MGRMITPFKPFAAGRILTTVLLGLLLLAGQKASAQYCTTGLYTTGCGAQDDIRDFTVQGVGASNITDLFTGCGAGGYQDRTAIDSCIFMQGNSYNGTLYNTYGGGSAIMWIDFNNDTTFQTT
jgi:hypothetical protein